MAEEGRRNPRVLQGKDEDQIQLNMDTDRNLLTITF